MSPEQAPGTAARPGRRGRALVRVLVVAAVAVGVTRLLTRGMQWDARQPEPAGFRRGLLHGAAMPLAWPGLLAGQDIRIYADRNTGRTYKLGYTLGVNACGALFFGWSYRRIARLRRAAAGGQRNGPRYTS